MKKVHFLTLLLFMILTINLQAWVFQPKPDLYYPEFGDFQLLADSYSWAQLGKYTRSFGNNELSMGLETGYQISLLRLPKMAAVLDVRLNLLNDFNPRNDWYFNPRAILVDSDLAFYFPFNQYFSQSVYIHHDCKHDVDLDSIWLVAHDWIGVSLHLEEQGWRWSSELDTKVQSEFGFNYFIDQLYDYLERDHHQARLFHTINSDIIRWRKVYSIFIQTNSEVFVSDLENPHNPGRQVYADFMGKTGFRFHAPDNRVFTLFAQWDYMNDNLMERSYEPAWYFSFGFSFSG